MKRRRMSKERKSVRGGRAHDGVGDGEWSSIRARVARPLEPQILATSPPFSRFYPSPRVFLPDSLHFVAFTWAGERKKRAGYDASASAIGRNRRQRDGPWVIPSPPPPTPSLSSPRGRRDVLRRARLYSVRRIMRLSLCDTLSNFLRSHGAVSRRPTSNRNVRTHHTDVPWKERKNSARSYAILLQDYCYARPGCEFSDAVVVAAAEAIPGNHHLARYSPPRNNIQRDTQGE